MEMFGYWMKGLVRARERWEGVRRVRRGEEGFDGGFSRLSRGPGGCSAGKWVGADEGGEGLAVGVARKKTSATGLRSCGRRRATANDFKRLAV